MVELRQTAALTLLLPFCYLASANNYAEIVQNHRLAEKCGEKKACVRFCCDDESYCQDSDHFNVSSLMEATNLNPEYAVIIGHPNCEMYELEEHDAWEFSEVRLFCEQTLFRCFKLCRFFF